MSNFEEESKRELDKYVESLEQSCALFSNKGKQARECWVVAEFLRNFGVHPKVSDVVPYEDEPPDVVYKCCRFEVKELLDPNRRRSDEYKEKLSRARKASGIHEMLEEFHPRHEPLQAVYEECLDIAARFAAHYAPDVVRSLDLLVYFNKQDVTGLTELPFPSTDNMAAIGWRSVSVLHGQRSCVFTASTHAPRFIRSNQGRVIHRARPQI